MKKGRFTDEQITFALRQAEAGTPVADVCRQMGCSEASFYLSKKRFVISARRRSASCGSCATRTAG